MRFVSAPFGGGPDSAFALHISIAANAPGRKRLGWVEIGRAALAADLPLPSIVTIPIG